MNSRFSPITDFESLGTGRDKRKVVISNSANFLDATELTIAVIKHNWKNETHRLIYFRDGRRFEMRTGMIDGKAVYLLPWTWEAEEHAKKLSIGKMLREYVCHANGDELVAAIELVNDALRERRRVFSKPLPTWERKSALVSFEADILRLSIRELKDLRALVFFKGQIAA